MTPVIAGGVGGVEHLVGLFRAPRLLVQERPGVVEQVGADLSMLTLSERVRGASHDLGKWRPA